MTGGDVDVLLLLRTTLYRGVSMILSSYLHTGRGRQLETSLKMMLSSTTLPVIITSVVKHYISLTPFSVNKKWTYMLSENKLKLDYIKLYWCAKVKWTMNAHFSHVCLFGKALKVQDIASDCFGGNPPLTQRQYAHVIVEHHIGYNMFFSPFPCT